MLIRAFSKAVLGGLIVIGLVGSPAIGVPGCVGCVRGEASAQTALSYVYEPLNFLSPDRQATVATAINDHGNIAGYYFDAIAQMRPFLFANGTFLSIDPAAAVAAVATDINNSGDVVGYFNEASGRAHGFVFRDGVIATFDVAGSSHTLIHGMSNTGDIVGEYYVPDADGVDRSHAFVTRAGLITTIEFSGACCIFPLDVNVSGEVVGIYLDHDGTAHAFKWKEGGLTSLDAQVAFAQVNGINDQGDIVGVYVEPPFADGQGFVIADGQFSQVHFPGSTGGAGSKVNNRGEIVGYYYPAPFGLSGFVAYPATRVAIDIKPGSATNTVNLGSSGTVPVALLSSPSFDATTVDPLSVTLASAPVRLNGKGTAMVSRQDVNGDGLLDLIVHVDTSALQLSETDSIATVKARTYSGSRVVGSDVVRVVP